MSKNFGFTQGHEGTEHEVWAAAGSVNTYSFDVKAPYGVAMLQLANTGATVGKSAGMTFTATDGDGNAVKLINPDSPQGGPQLSQIVNMHEGQQVAEVDMDVTPGKHYIVKVTAGAPMACMFTFGMTRKR